MLIDASGQMEGIHQKDMENIEVFKFKMIDEQFPREISDTPFTTSHIRSKTSSLAISMIINTIFQQNCSPYAYAVISPSPSSKISHATRVPHPKPMSSARIPPQRLQKPQRLPCFKTVLKGSNKKSETKKHYTSQFGCCRSCHRFTLIQHHVSYNFVYPTLHCITHIHIHTHLSPCHVSEQLSYDLPPSSHLIQLHHQLQLHTKLQALNQPIHTNFLVRLFARSRINVRKS